MSHTRAIARSLLRNLVQAVPTVLIIVTFGFVLLQLAPGDAADYLAAESGVGDEVTIAILRRNFGLDLPVLEQLLRYYGNLARFSLGESARFGMPVADLIWQRLPGTLLLMVSAITLALGLGIAAGTVMGLMAGRAADRVLSVVTLLFYSIPGFWIGLMLIVVFAARLGWLPSGGSGTIGADLSPMGTLLDRARHLILPVLSLSLYYVAIYARLTRASVLEVRGQDHVRTAIAKGLRPAPLVRRHILRNALSPVLTMAGVHVAGILGGAVVVETVFSWPGMGRLAYEAILAREQNVLLGILLISALMVIAANALFDLLQTLIDPRIGLR